MNKLHKIKAFTLIDVLVSLVITSIVITGAYYFLNYLQQGKAFFESDSSANYELKKTHNRLHHLFFSSEKINNKGDLLIFKQDSTIVTAEINNDQITINDGVAHSLNWDLRDYSYTETKNGNHLKSITLIFEFKDETFEWYFYKQYGTLYLSVNDEY